MLSGRRFGVLLPVAYLLASAQKVAAACSPTAPGICTLRIAGPLSNYDSHLEGGQCTWENAYIYDKDCNEIGHLAKYPISQGDAVFSELPYAVVMTLLYEGKGQDYNHIGMAYGSYSWDGVAACQLNGTVDTMPINWCLHTFPCG